LTVGNKETKYRFSGNFSSIYSFILILMGDVSISVDSGFKRGQIVSMVIFISSTGKARMTISAFSTHSSIFKAIVSNAPLSNAFLELGGNLSKPVRWIT